MSQGGAQGKLINGLMDHVLKTHGDLELAAIAREMPDDELWVEHGRVFNHLVVLKTEHGKLNVKEEAGAARWLEVLRAEYVSRGPDYPERAARLVVPRMDTTELEQMRAALRRQLPTAGPAEPFARMMLGLVGAELAKRAALS